MLYPDIPKFLKWLVGFVVAIATGWGVCLLIAGFGCSTQERIGIAQGVARTATRTAIETLTDQFVVLSDRIPTQGQSTSDANYRAIATLISGAAVYLLRKKFFPMGKR